MRRNYEMAGSDEVLADGVLLIDLLSGRVTKNGSAIALSVKEYELLLLFIRNKNRTLNKEWIFNQVWGIGSDSYYATLTVHINKLREKIEDNPKAPKSIKTVWGIGYRYETD